MSPLDAEVPPAGEEIHLPGPSLLPILFTVGATSALLGATMGPVLWIPGLILVVLVVVRWVVSTRQEIEELPLEHHH